MAGLTGITLGNYLVQERIGRGGMAEVYKGYHQRLNRHVAIKVLHGYLAEGQDFLARFEREARAVAFLRHPNIVQIHDFDAQDDHCYMVMEYIEGGTLSDWLAERRGRVDMEELLAIMEQIGSALDYAHSQGLVHRDIKPSNILIDPEGHVFLTDFGIARIVSSTQFTASGALIGTPAYMSPEQCRGDEISHVSDIYSLGVILYELLTGYQPYIADTPLSILQKHIMDPVPSLRGSGGKLPDSFNVIVQKTMAKAAADRYQSAAELLVDLRDAVAGLTAPTKEAVPETHDPTTAPTVVMEKEAEAAPTISQEPSVPLAVDEEDSDDPLASVAEDIIEEAFDRAMGKYGEEKAPEPSAEAQQQVLTEESPLLEINADSPEQSITSTSKKFPWKIVLPLGAVAVTLGVLIALGVIPLGGTADCADPWECRDLGIEAREGGELPLAGDYYLEAANLIEGPSREFAPIWCEGGELFSRLSWWEEAYHFSAKCFMAERNMDDCRSLEECANMAHEAMESGNMTAANEMLGYAIARVPGEMEGEYSYLWCERATVMEHMGNGDMAHEYLVTCDEWSQ